MSHVAGFAPKTHSGHRNASKLGLWSHGSRRLSLTEIQGLKDAIPLLSHRDQMIIGDLLSGKKRGEISQFFRPMDRAACSRKCRPLGPDSITKVVKRFGNMANITALTSHELTRLGRSIDFSRD